MRLFPELGADALIAERLAPLTFAALEPGESPELAEQLRPHALQSAARDLAMTAALREIAEHCPPRFLVLKGAATGLSHYADSAHRPRSDIDVWVDGWEAAEQLADRLERVGYSRAHQLPGQYARHAIAMTRADGTPVDVHARCSRRVRLERALPFDLAWEQRRALPGQLFAPADHHAWLLLAAHLTAHHAGQHILGIHLEDLRRLGASVTTDQWIELSAMVTNHQLASALRPAAVALHDWAPGILTPHVHRLLATPDASAAFSHPITAVLDDLELLNPREQATYLREVAYPPAEFLARQLGVARPRPRALLALHRIVEGVRRATLSRRSSTDAA